MKKLFVFVVLCSFFALASFSQTGFRPGFIITNEGDTIQGKVAYLDESILLRSCQFIAEGVSTAATYTPGEIFGYGFTGDKFFVSKEVTVFTPSYIRRSPIGDTQVPESSVQENVFLELVVQGAANLFKYNAAVFYASKNGEVFQLYTEEREVAVQTGATTTFYTEEVKRYVGILQMIMQDCQGFSARVNQTILNEESLTPLFIDYSRCRDVTPDYFKGSRKRFVFSFSLMGGLNGSLNRFQNATSMTDILSQKEFGFKANPGFGLMFEIGNERFRENLNLLLGVIIVPGIKYEGTKTHNEGVLTINQRVEMELTEIKIPVGLKYSFIRKSFRPYFAAGAVYVLNTSIHDYWYREQVGQQGPIVLNTPDFFLKSNQFGFWGSLGAETPVSNKLKLVTELGFQRTDGITIKPFPAPFSEVIPKRFSTHLMVGLKF